MRGNRTGLQFKPLFEHGIAELEKAGVGKSDRDLFLAYLKKCGENMMNVILKDRREYIARDGERSTRAPDTWPEAHRVLLEEEALMSGSRALVAALSGMSGGNADASSMTKAQRKKLAKQAAGTSPQLAGLDGDGLACRICWRMRDLGFCDRLNCQYNHEKQPKKDGATTRDSGRKGKDTKGKSKGKGKDEKGKGKRKGKEEKGKRNDKGKSFGKGFDTSMRPTYKSKEQCRAYAAGTCARGDSCGFSHDPNQMRGLIAALQSNPQVGGCPAAVSYTHLTLPTKA